MIEEMTCLELGERVTVLTGGMRPPEELARLQAHLSSRDGCHAHLEQMRTAVRILETMPKQHLSGGRPEHAGNCRGAGQRSTRSGTDDTVTTIWFTS
jgi:hypothetical protein